MLWLGLVPLIAVYVDLLHSTKSTLTPTVSHATVFPASLTSGGGGGGANASITHPVYFYYRMVLSCILKLHIETCHRLAVEDCLLTEQPSNCKKTPLWFLVGTPIIEVSAQFASEYYPWSHICDVSTVVGVSGGRSFELVFFLRDQTAKRESLPGECSDFTCISITTHASNSLTYCVVTALTAMVRSRRSIPLRRPFWYCLLLGGALCLRSRSVRHLNERFVL